MSHGAYTTLVVEDDAAIRSLVVTAFELQGARCLVAENADQALKLIVSQAPDIILLDLGLPDRDGVEVIETVRTWSNVPILVLSARSEDADKIGALDAGADDYLVKPFSVDELMARVRVALRHAGDAAGTAGEARYVNGSLEIDFAAGSVLVEGAEVHLTPMEYKLLCLLARNTGKVLTYNQILKEVWGTALACDMPTLRVFMATLRKKIESDPARPRFVQTHVGVGYKMLWVDDGK